MKKGIIKNFFLITIPVSIILFLLLEIIIRVSFTKIDYYDNPMNYWSEPSPYFNMTAKPGIYGDKTVNSHGFISTPEISFSKSDSLIRIVFLGGSSTAGMGFNLKDEETWPWKTIQLLKNQNKHIKLDFINGALGAFTTFESYGRLWSQLRFFKPDIIVVSHAWNDLYYFNEMADNPMLWHREIAKERPNEGWNAIKIKLLSWSQILTRIKIFIDKSRYTKGEIGNDKGLTSKYNTKGLDIYEENMVLLKSFANEFNCELFICKQPTLISKNSSEKDKAKCRYEYHGFNHEEHVKAFNAIYSLIDEKMENKNIIDLTSLSGISENFYDHIHPTSRGSSKIAKIVSDSLQMNFFNLRK